MKLSKLTILLLLAFAFGACTTATQTKKEEVPGKKEATEKKPEKETTTSAEKYATPTATVKAFKDALVKKDEVAMLGALSKKSSEVVKVMAGDFKKTPIEFLSPENPDDLKKETEFQNEKIDGDKATLEVREDKDEWETLPFVKEDGAWKLSMFDKDYEKAMKSKKEKEG